ncbi:MAG: carbohydrate kinase family protein [Clostridia bacterium]|nr:carbohydrate kinase family protein [Clostridia bacterium]
MEREGIAVVGTCIVDKIKEIDRYPAAGELTKIRSITLAPGGLVPNDGVDIKRMRPSLPVYAVGKVGADPEGKFLTDFLSANGLDTTHMAVSADGTTDFTDVMSVRGGQRTFFTSPGVGTTFGFADVNWETLPCKLLHLGYFLLLDRVDQGDGLRILQEAQKRGIRTSIDLVSESSDRYRLVRPCLPYTDNLIINELEGGRLCGIEPTENNLPEIARALKALGVRERVILHTPKLGVCFDGETLTELPSYALPSGYIQGTTGAGDAYCAGALIGIYEGRSDREILQMARVAATVSLGAPDATSGMKSYEEMLELCKAFKEL